ncbi:SH3 domain-containing protein [Fictibacillus nanhaiensis]|uniref:SH3 domain-containing protein n=1 Tax=Fictibacillus nanhaiensis TaxID=742169 RepID=UPI001C93D7C2|nr:SH3 domain-containing protein [Fictibacillus nanhaiensis]MBY6036475.1 SH3 domain-containing protein [Fictibacillus nanhaiensis]
MKVNLKRVNLIFCLILLLSTVQAFPASAQNKATVNATSLNVREQPSLSSKKVGSLKNGETVTVFKTEKGWSQISFNGKKAWASTEFLKMNSTSPATGSSPKKEEPKTRVVKQAKVTATSLNVRKGPATDQAIVGALKNGTIVAVLKQEGKWSSITYGKMTGWVSNAYLLDQSTNLKIPETPQNPDKKNENNTPAKQGKWGTVTANYLNFRSSGHLNAPIIGSFKSGTAVQILSEVNGWSSVQTTDGKKGWVSSKYVSVQNGTSPVKIPTNSETKPPAPPPASVLKKVVVMADGVNIRQGPSTSYLIVGKANQGDEYVYVQSKNDWVQLKLSNGNSAWIAGWLVAIQQTGSSKNPSNPGTSAPKPTTAGLKGKRIVIDPGHGGHDPGALGKAHGTHESDLTLMSARLVATELSKAGAVVILTRSDSTYVSLNKRVEISHYHFADAFISLHYNSAHDSRASGLLTFYYGQKDTKLAEAVHSGLVHANTGLSGGNVRFGNFHVLRENKQPAVLVELGFLSNPFDEMTVRSNAFQSKAATGITNGLAKYFQ